MIQGPSIIWLGGIFDEKTVISCSAVSPAANRWQSGLITALSECGCAIRIVAHRPEPAWPRGAFYVRGGNADTPLKVNGPKIPQYLAGYPNIYSLRQYLLTRRYSKIFRLVVTGARPQFILSYNVYPHCSVVGRYGINKGIGWIPVVADVPGDPAAYQELELELRSATGCVFLSWHSYNEWHLGPKFHLDGGVSSLCQLEPEEAARDDLKFILYSGMLNKYGGIDLLLQAFSIVKDPQARLWICGKGENTNLSEALKSDNRIIFHGCVDEETLQRLSSKSSVMINPRPGSITENHHNFPSKVLEYLSYGKPVISTWTPGLAPEYRRVLIVPDDETPIAMARTLETVLNWSETQRREHSKRLRSYVMKERMWRIQAERLCSWLRQL